MEALGAARSCSAPAASTDWWTGRGVEGRGEGGGGRGLSQTGTGRLRLKSEDLVHKQQNKVTRIRRLCIMYRLPEVIRGAYFHRRGVFFGMKYVFIKKKPYSAGFGGVQ